MVGGSNPLTPTINFEAKFPPKPPTSLAAVKPGQHLGNKLGNNAPHPAYAELIRKLLTYQVENGCPDSYLASRIGVCRTYYSRLKNGQKPLTPRVAAGIYQFLTEEGLQLLFCHPFSASINMDAIQAAATNAETELAQAIKSFLTAKQVEGKTAATLTFYRDNLGRFLWWWRTQAYPEQVALITSTHLRAFLLYVRTAEKRWGIGSISSNHLASMSTVDAYWRTLQALFSWLVKEETVESARNPFRKIPRLKVPEKVVQDIPKSLFSKAQGLFDPDTLVGRRNRAWLMFMVDSGARLDECQKLNFEDLHLADGYALVWGKGGKQRVVGIASEARQAMESYFELHPLQSGAVWVTEDGHRLSRSGIQSMVRRLKKLGGGVRWSSHTFRNTWAINFLRGTGDVFSLQTLGGWTDLEMPRHYTRALKAEDALRVHRRASPGNNFMSNE